MTQSQSQPLIWQYIQQQHVINIAVSGQDDLWAFTAFYAADPVNGELILFSGATTRHGTIMTRHPRVTGTIADPHQEVNELKGLQFSGTICIIPQKESAPAFALYRKAFPFIREMPAEAAWRLRFDHLKLTDNSLGFGTKIEWQIS